MPAAQGTGRTVAAELFTHSHVPPAARPSLPLCRDRDGEERRWIDVDQCMGELVFVSYSHIRIGIGESYSCKNDTANITDRWTDKIVSF